MTERTRQTLTAPDLRDGDYDDEERGQTMTTENQTSSGISTADMAAAMKGQGETTPNTADRDGADARQPPLFAGNESDTFRSRWTEVQTGFVDEPRHAVEQADGLVAEVVQRLVQTFADERKHLEEQWGQGDDVSTEDLRIALQRYRSFFERLLST